MSQLPQKTLRILIKAILLFIVFNYAFALVPDSVLWKISFYNTLWPGKTRFPSENDLDLMFDIHEIANSSQRTNEYKVVLLGDSATWGYLLNPDETFSSLINASGVPTCKGQTVHVYNLGYPSPFTLRDIMILQRALSYKPDLIIWNVSLISMLESKKDVESNIIIRNNLALTKNLVEQYNLETDLTGLEASSPPGKTFLDRREEIARFIQYQLNGIRWQAIGGEKVNKGYVRLSMNVSANPVFANKGIRNYYVPPPTLDPKLLHLDILNAGIRMAGDIPMVIINQPIQAVNGKNSDIRYNMLYPRWVYDQYRELMSAQSKQYGWHYFDLWNIIPPTQFTDTPFHRTVKGEQRFAKKMQNIILKNACPGS